MMPDDSEHPLNDAPYEHAVLDEGDLAEILDTHLDYIKVRTPGIVEAIQNDIHDDLAQHVCVPLPEPDADPDETPNVARSSIQIPGVGKLLYPHTFVYTGAFIEGDADPDLSETEILSRVKSEVEIAGVTVELLPTKQSREEYYS